MTNFTAPFEILELDDFYSIVLIDLNNIVFEDQEIAIYRVLKKIKRQGFEIALVKNVKSIVFDFSIPQSCIDTLENYQPPLFLVKNAY